LKNLKEYTNYGNYTISNPDYNNQRRENIENLNDTIGEINKNNEELEENKAKLKEIERIIAPTEGRKTLLGRLEQNIETPIAKRTLKQINVVKKAWPKIRQLNQGKSTPTPPEKGDSQTSFVNKMTGTNDLLNTPSKSAPSSGLPPTPPETSKSRPNSPYYRDNKSSTLRKQATETQYGKSSSLSPSSSSASLTSQSRPLSGRSDDSTSRPSNASTDSSLSRSSSQSGYPKLINSNSTSSIRTIGTKGNTQSRPPFNSAVRPHTAPGYGLSRKGGKNTRKHKPSNHTNTHNKKTHKQHQSNKQTRKQHKQSHKHKRTIKRQ
jgi:hypothetical protein